MSMDCSETESREEPTKETHSLDKIPAQLFDHFDESICKNERKEEEGYFGRIGRFIGMVYPHFLLYLGTLMFIFAIALLFHYIEGESEKDEKQLMDNTIRQLERKFMGQMQRIAHGISRDRLEKETHSFARQIVQQNGAHGRLENQQQLLQYGNNRKWTMANSMLFATSLVARVGYGHIVPVTTAGKLLTILMASLGLPLFLLTVSDMAKFAEDFLSYFSRCVYYFKKIRRNQFVQDEDLENDDYIYKLFKPSLLLMSLTLFLIGIALAFVYTKLEEWSWLDSFYFVFVSLSCIGFGDLAPTSALSSLATVCMLVLFSGLCHLVIEKACTSYLIKIYRLSLLKNRVKEFSMHRRKNTQSNH